jgi:hypothetical protein
LPSSAINPGATLHITPLRDNTTKPIYIERLFHIQDISRTLSDQKEFVPTGIASIPYRY